MIHNERIKLSGFGPDETRWAFIATTALLTVIPLVMLGGAVWFIRRKVEKHSISKNSI